MKMAEEREGGDITASDMILPEEIPSEIVKFFTDSTIFLTGATGFIGKLFLEKLLRTCSDLKRIYIIVRPKKGKEIAKRYEEIFEGPTFEPLKRKNPDVIKKVVMLYGDLCQPDLGLNEADKERLYEEVNCVIHCAATVRFDEKLRTAAHINVRAVRDLLKMAKQMKQLKAFTYISTAFANCVRKTVEETIYDSPLNGDQLLTLVDCLDDDKLDAVTPIFLGDYPNSYVFTKVVAENVLRDEGKSIPLTIFRPSIVIATSKEPIAGYIDNVYGATGVLMGSATGVLRSLQGKKSNRAELVPADFVVNGALAATWDVATMKSLNDNKESKIEESSREEKYEKEIPIYNFVSTPERPISWDLFEKLSKKHATQIPSELCIWHYFFALRSCRYHHLLAVFFYQTVPAYIVDFIALCIGKKPMLVKGYQKINKFADVIGYFCMREWDFKNRNTQALWKRLNKTDQELFEFSMGNLDWDAFWYTYVRGARIYLLKDPLETVPKGLVKYNRLMAAHYALVSVVLGLMLMLLYKFVNFVVGVIF